MLSVKSLEGWQGDGVIAYLDTEEETQLSIEIGAIQAAALDLGRAIRILKAAAKFNA